MHWFYYLGRFLIHIVAFPFARWQIKGRENIPDQGPFLIVCNHLHLADPPIVAGSLKLKTVFMAKEELFRSRWSRFWVQNFGAFSVRRGGIDREVLRQAENWVKRGVSIIMFPEGTRSKNAQMQSALPGSVLIASRLGIPILPVSITGTEKLKNLKWCLWHRPTITVNIGQPFRLPLTDGKLTKEARYQLTNSIMERVAGLLPQEYQGVYARGENAGHQTPQERRL
jgi:1-acyl-sn-glycerol-3-phosphate acyltransferase